MPLSVGDKLGPYEILAPIGAGGMGEVWKARDTRLNRVVAVKRLNGNHSARFEQEARAIAALNHPHICQIFDVGPDYLVLEYIEGQPLKGPLAVEEATRLAVQIAGALDAAHRKGVVHRDLKPANIMVTSEGSVKLLDFGLARLVADPEETATVEGAVMGTAGYMAPEQAEGQPPDARSDVFSFGAVLYELLSGQRAFRGETFVATIAAILHKEPAPLDAPPALEQIVKRCLAKPPGQRYQSMAELKFALEHISTKAANQQPSIAVLPFANISGDKDQEYFSDGLAEEIINALVKIPGLKVIARTSAFAFRGQNTDIRKIAETLGVANIIEGSVRRSGNRIRVTAQLIAAADGSHLWSERYDRELADVFAVQDEIAAAIAGALQIKLAVPPAEQRRYTPNLPAYDAYMKGQHHWLKITPESLARSKECYEQAIALDPGFALAHIGLANYFLMMTAGAALLPAHEAMPRVRALAQRAVEIDPLLSEAHGMLAIVTGLYDYDWKGAERLFRLAMARDPVPPWVHSWHGYFYLMPMSRLRDAIAELERALQGDPLNTIFRLCLAFGLMQADRYEDASAECRRLLELDENYWFGYSVLAWSLLLRGMPAEALSAAEKGYSLAPWQSITTGTFAAVLQRTGDTKRAEQVLQPLRNAPDKYAGPRGLAVSHFLCGEIDQAADWLEKSVAQRDPYGVLWSRWFLQSSARWRTLERITHPLERVP
jgi:serine/threonine protein kinase